MTFLYAFQGPVKYEYPQLVWEKEGGKDVPLDNKESSECHFRHYWSEEKNRFNGHGHCENVFDILS